MRRFHGIKDKPYAYSCAPNMAPLISGHLSGAASFDLQIYLHVNWGENKLYPHVHPLSFQLEPMS